MSNKPAILSLFDHSKVWGGMYEKAGYYVIYFDIKDAGKDGCVLERFPSWLIPEKDLIHGIIAMPPCTDFSGSGAWKWPDKDAAGSADCDCCDSRTEHSLMLVYATLAMVEFLEPKWWVLENPVGRLERLVPELKPYRRLSFNPCDYGDPYTKKTILWGEFNADLPKNPVEPNNGSMITDKLSSKSEKRGLRSLTPSGFAKAFFEANP